MSAKPVTPQKAQSASARQWIRLVVAYLLIALILLICGGDLGWWQAWLYSLLILAAGIGGAHLGGEAASRIDGRTPKY